MDASAAVSIEIRMADAVGEASLVVRIGPEPECDHIAARGERGRAALDGAK